MRIQIEPSEIFAVVRGVKCRVWNGVTEDDKQVFVFVAGVSSPETLEGLIDLGWMEVDRLHEKA
jgi:hypothetical protein